MNLARIHAMLQIAFLCLVISAGISAIKTTENESIYDILTANGFPAGIFPKGVKEFTFNVKTGRFSVYLNQSCEAKYETKLRYSTNITGTIESSQILDLTGISAYDLFLWFPVKGIRVDVPSSGLIYFDIGVVHKQISLSVFETPSECVAVPVGHKVEGSMLPLYQLGETRGRNII